MRIALETAVGICVCGFQAMVQWNKREPKDRDRRFWQSWEDLLYFPLQA